MAEEPKLPPLLVEQIDKLYSILKSMPELLQIGRAYGLVVGLSPVFGGEIVRRHWPMFGELSLRQTSTVEVLAWLHPAPRQATLG